MDDDQVAQQAGQRPLVDHLNRPLSPFEVVFWRLAQAGSLNVTSIASVQGPLAEPALKAGLKQVQQRHPLLQVRIRASGNEARFATQGVPEIGLRLVDRAPAEVPATVEEELNDAIDAERGPLARCTWIRHGETEHHLLITFHHAIGDGMSGAYMMRDLLRAASAHLDSGAGEGSLGDPLTDSRPMDLRLPPGARGLSGFWKQLRFVVGVAREDFRLRPPSRPVPDQTALLSARQTQLISRQFPADFVDTLARSTRAQNTTVHGALSAAICLATAHDHSSTEPMSVKHRSPVNVRQQLDPPVADDVGMFASMTFYRGRIRSTDDFWDLARNIRGTIKDQVDRGVPEALIGMLPRLYRMIGGRRLNADDFGQRWQQRTPSTTGLTNLGRVELEGRFGPLDMRGLHFAVSPGGLGDCACTATTYAGELRWNFVYATPLFTAERARRITEDAVARLTQAILTATSESSTSALDSNH